MKEILKELTDAYESFSRVPVSGEASICMAQGLVLLKQVFAELKEIDEKEDEEVEDEEVEDETE